MKRLRTLPIGILLGSVAECGPAKRLYELTSAGKTCLTEWTETLDRYRKGVGELVAMMRRAVAQSESLETASGRREDRRPVLPDRNAQAKQALQQ